MHIDDEPDGYTMRVVLDEDTGRDDIVQHLQTYGFDYPDNAGDVTSLRLDQADVYVTEDSVDLRSYRERPDDTFLEEGLAAVLRGDSVPIDVEQYFSEDTSDDVEYADLMVGEEVEVWWEKTGVPSRPNF